MSDGGPTSSNNVWSGVDWSPSFRENILNTAVPIAALLLSLIILSIQGALSTKRHAASAERVASLDPASSRIALNIEFDEQQNEGETEEETEEEEEEEGQEDEGDEIEQEDVTSRRLVPQLRRPSLLERVLTFIMPWTAPFVVAKLSMETSRSSRGRRTKRNRAVELPESDTDGPPRSSVEKAVFHTENAVILNEVHTTMSRVVSNPLDPVSTSPLRATTAEVIKRAWEVIGCMALAGAAAADLALVREPSGQRMKWVWLILWIYLAVLSAYTITARRSLFTHKALLFTLATLIAISNLRSNVLAPRSTHWRSQVVISSVQLALSCLTLVPSLFFPLETRLPSRLRAIHQTIKAQKAYGEARTAIPTPRNRRSPTHSTLMEGAEDIAGPSAATNPDLSNACSIEEGHKVKETGTSNLIPSPENRASVISRAFFSFVTPAMMKHYKEQFTLATVPDLPPADQAACVVAAFRADKDGPGIAKAAKCKNRISRSRLTEEEPLLRKRKSKERLSRSNQFLGLRLARHFAPLLVFQCFWALLEAFFTLTPPIGLRFVLTFIGNRSRGATNTPVHMAVLYATGMLMGQLIAATCTSQALFQGRRLCIRLRAILIFEIVNKALRRRDTGGSSKPAETEGIDDSRGSNNNSKDDLQKSKSGRASDGEVTNLVSVDVFKVSEIGSYMHFLFPSAPLQIIFCVYLLINLLGWPAVGGVGVLILSLPLQTVSARLFVKLQKRLLEATDRRLNLTSEVLNCIKTVKFFAWEKSFQRRLDEARERELRALYYRIGAWLLNACIYIGMTMIVSLVTFSIHTGILHRPLPAEIAFTALALFNALRHPLDAFPDMLVNVLTAVVSIRRIDHYLREEETTKYEQLLDNTDRDLADPIVGFRGATFTYSEDDEAIQAGSAFCLRNLNLHFPIGQLTVIAGPVGCGKTTLLMSLLGETKRLAGKTFIPCPVARSLEEVDPVLGLSESVAFCSQSPWLLGATVRENILFGQVYNESRYQAVLRACALEPDLKILEYYDETEVGEKGTSLSGGQKARLALARALYSPAKYLLIDDALSAVDVHTAKHLFHHYFKGPLMNGRTCILVTHAVQLCLPGAALAVALDEGRIKASGSPQDVLATGIFDDETTQTSSGTQTPNKTVESAIKADGDNVPEEEPTIEELDEGTRAAEQDEIKKKQDKKALFDNEETYGKGSVGFKAYRLYISSFAGTKGGLVFFWAFAVSVFVAARGMDVVATAWLRKWAGSYDEPQERGQIALAVFPPIQALIPGQQWLHASFTSTSTFLGDICNSFIDNAWRWASNAAPPPAQQMVLGVNDGLVEDRTQYFLTGYALLIILFILIAICRDGIGLIGSLRASRSLYRRLMTTIMFAKPQWFDRTPIGRIMNRLSKDIETIDQDLAPQLIFFVDVCIQSFIILIVSCYVVPAFTLISAVVVVLYWFIGALYIVSSRDLKRIESVSRSPIYTLVGEALSGAVLIRAYGDASRFARHCLRLIDKTNRPFFFLWYENRWLSQRVDSLSSLVTFLMAMILIYNEKVDAALAGFVLSFTIQLVDAVLWVLRMYTAIEINANGVERIAEYLAVESEKQHGLEPPAAWPSKLGSLRVENLAVRYAPEFPHVLHNISFEVAPGEKVGICGRTGSGKSSLALALFRFLEAEEGQITIDGIDIATVPLETLRRRLTVIPQDAQLFSGTVRSNLDPFGVCEDAELWIALERCQLASRNTPATSRNPTRPSSPSHDDADGEILPTKVITSLEMAIEQGGKNFSAGQKQLLALARGLIKLRASNIVVLDESTASLDHNSDAAIQRTIHSEMAGATILTVAHRIRGIATYDRVLVLDHGNILEYDAPSKLMKTEDSSFRELCVRSGEYDLLLEMAVGADREREARRVQNQQ